MMKSIIFILFSSLFVFCSSNSGEDDSKVAPKVVSISPINGATEIPVSTIIKIDFNKPVKISDNPQILVNGTVHTGYINDKCLSIMPTLEIGMPYDILVKKPTITDLYGNAAEDIAFSFSTETILPGFDIEAFNIKSNLCIPNPTPEAINVYNFLCDNFGKKIVSGIMANVGWNWDEAKWVYNKTGKWPALHGFDYIHLAWEPANWNDYTDMSYIEDWWQANGLVSCMWHWNVPKNGVDNRPNDMAFYTDDTNFDITKALTEGTFEKSIIDADLAKITDYLKLVHAKNIPVLWRPLHEASGGWFWWGSKGPEACKALWRYMFEYFQNEGLNNLIWIWTMEENDADWYPGDEYVDIIGRDYYPQSNIHASMISRFNNLKNITGGKYIIALSECGGIPDPSKMYSEGDMWSWFMPWYGNFTRDNNQNGDYWETVLNHPLVITRDQMPNLKNQ